MALSVTTLPLKGHRFELFTYPAPNPDPDYTDQIPPCQEQQRLSGCEIQGLHVVSHKVTFLSPPRNSHLTQWMALSFLNTCFMTILCFPSCFLTTSVICPQPWPLFLEVILLYAFSLAKWTHVAQSIKYHLYFLYPPSQSQLLYIHLLPTKDLMVYLVFPLAYLTDALNSKV